MKLQVKHQILGMCDTLREAVQYAKSAKPEQAYNVLCEAYSAVDSIKKSVSEGFVAQLADEYIKICDALQDSLENMNAALQTGSMAKEAAGKVRGKLRLLAEKLSSEKQIEKTGKVIFFMCAYNTPPAYLRKAVISVLGQSDPDLLFLILDHGSTDGTTAKILQDYAKQDERIILFRCEKNMKLNAKDDPETFDKWEKLLKNIMNESGAEYFASIDSDDVYAPDFLKEMYSVAKKNDSDIAVCGTTMIKENGTICANRIPLALTVNDKKISENDFINLYGSLRPLWCKLYSMRLWQRFFDLFFELVGKNGADTLIVLNLMCEIEIFVSVPKCLHFYRVRKESYFSKWPVASRITEGDQIFEAGIKFTKYYNCFTKKTEKFLEAVYRNHILDLFNMIKACANKRPIEAAKFIRVALDDQFYRKVCVQNPDFLSDAMQTIAEILNYADKEKIQCLLNTPVNTQKIKNDIELDIINGDYDKAMADDASFLLETPLNEMALLFRLKIDNHTATRTKDEKIFAGLARTLYPETKKLNP